MRLGALRFVGTSFVVGLTLAGCAPRADHTSSSQLWPWKNDQEAPGLLSDLSRPFPKVPGARAGEADVEAPPSPAEFSETHPMVEEYVERFQGDLRNFFSRALERSGKYVPRMSAILAKQGLPTELAYLPLIESGYVPHAVSPAGAAGPWQFIRATGRRYGLQVDRVVDERRDPIKSTEAAGRYLKDLHEMFGDWNLALAAYNTGEGNIARVTERHDADNFWDLIDQGCLYKETEHYVPRFLAALRIAREPEAYGFAVPEIEDIDYDWVHVTHPLSLAKIAELSGTSKAAVTELNPSLRAGVVPRGGYTVRLPKGSKHAFQLASAKIDPSMFAWSPRSAGCDDDMHCVASGETLAVIARKYGVSVDQLKRENGIRNANSLQVGRALYIPGRKPRTVSDTRVAAATATHRVGRGETVGGIASKYGTSAQALMNANGIRNPRSLKVGQNLKIPGRRGVVVAKASAPATTSVATTHKLRKGETIGAVAGRYGVSTQALLQANGIRDTRRLQIGQTLKIPGKASAAPKVVAATPKVPQPKLAAPKTVAKAAAPAAARTHKLGKGETIGAVAARYGVSTQALLQANGIRDARRLQIGQTLKIPSGSAAKAPAKVAAATPATTKHTVRSGESPHTIAKRYGVTPQELLRANGIRDPRGLKPGQVLTVPKRGAKLAAR